MQSALLPLPPEEENCRYLAVTADHLLRGSWAADPDYPTARAAREAGFRNCSGDITALTLSKAVYHYDPPLQGRLQEWHRWQHRRCAGTDAAGLSSPPEPFAAALSPPAPRPSPAAAGNKAAPLAKAARTPGIRNSLWQCEECRFALRVSRRRSREAYYDCASPALTNHQRGRATAPHKTAAAVGNRPEAPGDLVV